MSLTRQERETIARFSDDPEDLMTFETFNKRQAMRLIAAGATVKRTSNRDGAIYWSLEMPRTWFRWPRKPRKASEAQLAHLRRLHEPDSGSPSTEG